MIFKITKGEMKLCRVLCLIILSPFIAMGFVGICGSSGLIYFAPVVLGMPWSLMTANFLATVTETLPSLHSSDRGTCAGPIDSVAFTLPALFNFIIIFFLIIFVRNIFLLIKSKFDKKFKPSKKVNTIILFIFGYSLLAITLYLTVLSSNRVSNVFDAPQEYNNKVFTNKSLIKYRTNLKHINNVNKKNEPMYFYKNQIDNIQHNCRNCFDKNMKSIKNPWISYIKPSTRFIVTGMFTHHSFNILSFSSILYSGRPDKYLIIKNIETGQELELHYNKFIDIFKNENMINKAKDIKTMTIDDLRALKKF